MGFLRSLWAHILSLFRGEDLPEDEFEDLDGPDGPHGRPTV